MKNIKIFIVTYKRSKILNKTLDILFNKTDFTTIPETEVNIINNHSDFSLNEEFVDKVNVIHNNARPDWDTGNLARNWNQSLVNGFKDLNNPCRKTSSSKLILLKPVKQAGDHSSNFFFNCSIKL